MEAGDLTGRNVSKEPLVLSVPGELCDDDVARSLRAAVL